MDSHASSGQILLTQHEEGHRDVREYLFDMLRQDGMTIPHKVYWNHSPPPLEGPWESVSIYFIIGLSRVNDYDAILVIVYQFSKYVIFLPTHMDYKVEEVAYIFLQNIFKL